MSSAKTGTIVCPECGEGNRATARFCTACAARLGAEPSAAGAVVPAPAALRHQSRRDAPHTVHSRPTPLGASASDSATFLVKFCIAGLIVLIGFIGWALYMLTASKAVPVLPVVQGSAAPSEAVAPSAAVPVSPPPQPVATLPVPTRIPPETPRVAPSVPVAAAPAFPEIRRPAATRRQTTRESAQPTMPVPNENGGEVAAVGNWVEPTRPPASTSSPLYRDPGPPIVQGPGPRESLLPTLPYPPMRSGSTVGMQGADPGPPIAEGPGPRYDYSTPGAVGR